MNEKPILFSTEMVRAILDGRKTQTRRVIKPQPPSDYSKLLGPEMYAPTIIDKDGFEQPGAEIFGAYTEDGEWGIKCPYGFPKSRLWVRETFYFPRQDLQPDNSLRVSYRADGEMKERARELGCKWHPSIFMPRWASRICLEIINIRVERVREINTADADAEVFGGKFPHDVMPELFGNGEGFSHLSIPECFGILWDSINAKRGYSWESNPWVWAVTFRKL